MKHAFLALALSLSHFAGAHPIERIFGAKDYTDLLSAVRSQETRSEQGRVAFYFGCLAIESLRRYQDPEKILMLDPKNDRRMILRPDPSRKQGQDFPLDIFNRAFGLMKEPHTGSPDQLMRLWVDQRVIEPNAPPFEEYGFKILTWSKIPAGSTEKPIPVYGWLPELTAERKRRDHAWRNRTDRFAELIFFRINNQPEHPAVSDADLAWLAGSDSPFRPVAIAELRVREGRSRRTGPWTPRWNAWAAQNRGVLRELLVRRVQRLLAPAPAGQPARTSSLPG